MTWVKVVRPTESEAVRDAMMKQRHLYPPVYGQPGDPARVPEPVLRDSIVLSHSLIPPALEHAFSAFGVLMDPSLPLERREHEMIATTVSALNKCFYWTESHAEFLRAETLDAAFADGLRADWRTAPGLTERDRAILTYVEKLTLKPATIREEDLEPLRAAGLDDTGIVQVNLIASWFNYINRVADGLGVGR